MNKYYVTGQIAFLDVGAEVADDISIVLDYIHLLETEYLGTLEGQHGTKKNV